MVKSRKCRRSSQTTDERNEEEFLGCLPCSPRRNTPTQGLDASPAQRLMSRRTKTLLLTTKNLLVPEVTLGQHQKILANKERQAKYYNKAAHDLPALTSGDVVRVNLSPDSLKQEDLQRAQLKAKVGVRSYEVETEDGKRFRRNRVHLRKSNEAFSTHQPTGELPFGYVPEASTATPLDSATLPIDPAAEQSPVGPAPTPATDPLGNFTDLVTICRVGHLSLRALAIRASDPQNALARTSFHSPKSLPPTTVSF